MSTPKRQPNSPALQPALLRTVCINRLIRISLSLMALCSAFSVTAQVSPQNITRQQWKHLNKLTGNNPLAKAIEITDHIKAKSLKLEQAYQAHVQVINGVEYRTPLRLVCIAVYHFHTRHYKLEYLLERFKEIAMEAG